MKNKVLHVVNISFVTRYFFGCQFKYLKNKTGNSYFLACSPSVEHTADAENYGYIPFDLEVKRNISPIHDLVSIFKLFKFIKKNKIEFVVGHTPKGGMIAMLASYFANTQNRIYFRHGIIYETSTGFKKIILKTIEKLSGTLATKVVCVSKSVKEFSERDKLNNSDKNIILGLGSCNGVDTEVDYNPNLISADTISQFKKKLKIEDEDFVVGFVGRLVKDKGIQDLVKAWVKLLESTRGIKLLLVGPFEERDTLSEEIKQIINLEKTIINTGLVNHTNLYYSCMDILILPTYREGFPTSVLEAGAMQIPVITTRATGCEESIIANETGVFTTHNIDDICRNILYYKNNPNIKFQHGKNARNFVTKNFEQKIIWDIIHEKLKY